MYYTSEQSQGNPLIMVLFTQWVTCPMARLSVAQCFICGALTHILMEYIIGSLLALQAMFIHLGEHWASFLHRRTCIAVVRIRHRWGLTDSRLTRGRIPGFVFVLPSPALAVRRSPIDHGRQQGRANLAVLNGTSYQLVKCFGIILLLY